MPCRPDTPPPKTHRQTKTLSPKRKSNGDRSREMPASSVKDEARPTTIPKALKERSSKASEAGKFRRRLTEVHVHVAEDQMRPIRQKRYIEAALERTRPGLNSPTKSVNYSTCKMKRA